MKNILLIATLTLLIAHANAQMISRFSWDKSPLTTAVFGANAISISSYAVAGDADNKTKGLNPGAGQHDINMLLDGAAFNVPALDISIDFRREESVASFFSRGTYFNFGINNNSLTATFLVKNGSSFTTVNSGSVYTVADDHAFHTYRFSYDDNTGSAKLLVDGKIVYTYTGTAGLPLYWTGAGNVTIGKDMDATGKNVPVLANLIIQQHANALLPLTLLSFNADHKNIGASLSWTTTRELNVVSFAVEKSVNASSFVAIKKVEALNGYTAINSYGFTDSSLGGVTTYYRLKMLNSDGSFTYSSIVSVTANDRQANASVFPNPATDYVVVKMRNAIAGKYIYTMTTAAGQLVMTTIMQVNNSTEQVRINLSAVAAKGILIMQLRNVQTGNVESFTIVRN